MKKYILKRILIAIPVLIGITILDYVMMSMAGSPLEMLQGPRVSEAAVEAKKIALEYTLQCDLYVYNQFIIVLPIVLPIILPTSSYRLQSRCP